MNCLNAVTYAATIACPCYEQKAQKILLSATNEIAFPYVWKN